MQVTDEYDIPWEVEAGDPARVHVNYLKSRGYEYIVLPRVTLTTGAVCGTMVDELSLATIRLLDCTSVLVEQAEAAARKAAK